MGCSTEPLIVILGRKSGQNISSRPFFPEESSCYWGTLIGRDMRTSIGIGRHEKTENHVTEQVHCTDLGNCHDLPLDFNEDFVDIPSAATDA